MAKLPSHYNFFAVFAYYKGGISITFPDLPGCVSHGDNETEAIRNAQQCLALHLCGMEEDGEKIPKPTPISEIQTQKGEAVVLIEVFMPPMRNHFKNSVVKKTLTIPQWLNEAAVAQNINFSKTLQKALMSELDIHR